MLDQRPSGGQTDVTCPCNSSPLPTPSLAHECPEILALLNLIARISIKRAEVIAVESSSKPPHFGVIPRSLP